MDELAHLSTALAGRYEIEREIGKGGMATVYLARDVRHDRRVALKLLNPELGAVLGVERFLSEIRVTAKLQHPNLLPLFDSGEVDGRLFYVMPYVAGETLRARLTRERQLPIDEALRIAVSVCGALDHAHRHGVIHRDLKPENILLNDGQPLVADFGIALAVSNAGGARITQTGLSLGTPQYMSPEQATGDRVIDARTDIYSLGAVTYEMLAGEPPHAAATSQGVIAKLLTEEPRSLTVLRRSVSLQVDAAVRHALEKLPADRFAAAKDFSDALLSKGGTSLGATGSARSRTAAATFYGAATICAICSIGAGVAWSRLGRIDAPLPIRFKLDLPEGQRLVSNPGASIAISPDGRTIAYAAAGSNSPTLYTRRLDELRSSRFPEVENPSDLAFSPDSRWLSFAGPSDILRVPAGGGRSVVLVDSASPSGTSWTLRGGFVFATSSGIWSVDSNRTKPRPIAGGDSTQKESNPAFPYVFPDGKDVIFRVFVPGERGHRMVMASTSGGKKTTLTAPWGNILGFRDGWLIYGTSRGTIDARKFDQATRRFSGDAIALADSVLWKGEGSGAEASLSATGTLAYIRGDASSVLTLLDGRGMNVGPTAAVRGLYDGATWSPDGKKIALGTTLTPGGIWIYDVTSRTLSRLSTRNSSYRPAWTADSKRVAYVSDEGLSATIRSMSVDGSGPEDLVYQLPGLKLREVVFSANGKYAVLRTDGESSVTQSDLYVLELQGAGERKARPIVDTPAEEYMPSLSPDSHWLAYESNETGKFEIYVRHLPDGGGRVQVSDEGGTEPRWAPDGAHIVYRVAGAFWSATVSAASGAPSVTKRDSLFAEPHWQSDDYGHQSYDISREGRFVGFRHSENMDLVVIANWWTEALARLQSK